MEHGNNILLLAPHLQRNAVIRKIWALDSSIGKSNRRKIHECNSLAPLLWTFIWVAEEKQFWQIHWLENRLGSMYVWLVGDLRTLVIYHCPWLAKSLSHVAVGGCFPWKRRVMGNKHWGVSFIHRKTDWLPHGQRWRSQQCVYQSPTQLSGREVSFFS